MYGSVRMRFQAEGNAVLHSSFEVRLFWESAACSPDDDVGSVVRRLHTLIQWFLLNKLRQKTCIIKESHEYKYKERKKHNK